MKIHIPKDSDKATVIIEEDEAINVRLSEDDESREVVLDNIDISRITINRDLGHGRIGASLKTLIRDNPNFK